MVPVFFCFLHFFSFKLNVLGWHWLIRPYRFQVYNVWHIICTLHCVSTNQSQLIFCHHIFDLFYPLLPSLPLPPGHHHNLSLWVFLCFFCLSCLFICCFQSCIPHMSKIVRFLTFSVWLISLNMIFSRSIQVVEIKEINFLNILIVKVK